MSVQRISFLNRAEDELSGVLEFPDHCDPHSFAIFAHCFICSDSLRATQLITRGLTDKGIAVLRLDFTGLEGRPQKNQFSSSVEDLLDAGMFLAEHYTAPVLLVGHSLGATAAILAAAHLKSVRAVASVSAPATLDAVERLLSGERDTAGVGSAAQIGGTPFVISEDFLEDIRHSSMDAALRSLDAPILLLHSPQDRTVPVANASELYEKAQHPKSFIAMEGANHLLTDERDAIYAGEVVASWAARYLDIPARETPETHHQVAVSLGNKGYTSEIIAGKHLLIADEPEDHGGKDYGPAPYEILSAALGACTAMTLRMYADRKKWDLQKVVVHLDHRKDYPGDADLLEKGVEKIDIIDRRIEVYGELDEQQKDRLIEIANKCPVHRTLTNPTRIDTSRKDT